MSRNTHVQFTFFLESRILHQPISEVESIVGYKVRNPNWMSGSICFSVIIGEMCLRITFLEFWKKEARG